MKNYKDLMLIAANSNMSILLQGESGSGKEVAARFIHKHSARCHAPFIALNCGAIVRNLAESMFEGAKRGAYTGAINHEGAVRAAEGGTLFLDEVGELPLETQVKLLRILQERAVTPLGETHSIPVDFRLICATNRDLKHEVAIGHFREDLFFRLNVFPVRVPPLRERDDIMEVSQSLWHEAIQEITPTENIENLSFEELELIEERDWPGNVRQLKNVLQRYALLKQYKVSLNEIICEEFNTRPNPVPKHYGAAPRWEIIQNELENNNWNKSVAAKNLGISRGSLDYQIKKNGSY